MVPKHQVAHPSYVHRPDPVHQLTPEGTRCSAYFPDAEGTNPLPHTSPSPKHLWSSDTPTRLGHFEGPYQETTFEDAPQPPHYLPWHLIHLIRMQLRLHATHRTERTQVFPPARINQTITYLLLRSHHLKWSSVYQFSFSFVLKAVLHKTYKQILKKNM